MFSPLPTFVTLLSFFSLGRAQSYCGSASAGGVLNWDAEWGDISAEDLADCTALVSIVIPANVENIGDSAFLRATELTSVTFSGTSSLKVIGAKAFKFCGKLGSIEIPSSVTKIGNNAFFEASALESVTFEVGTSLKTIERRTFRNCNMLKGITIPASVTEIGEEAFKHADDLEWVVIETGSNLNSIDLGAFKDCGSLCDINIPAGVTIGTGAFAACLFPEAAYVVGTHVKLCTTLQPSAAPSTHASTTPSFTPSLNPSMAPSPEVTIVSSPESSAEPSAGASAGPSMGPTVCESEMTLNYATLNAAAKVAKAKETSDAAELAKSMLVEAQEELELTVDCNCGFNTAAEPPTPPPTFAGTSTPSGIPSPESNMY